LTDINIFVNIKYINIEDRCIYEHRFKRDV